MLMDLVLAMMMVLSGGDDNGPSLELKDFSKDNVGGEQQ